MYYSLKTPITIEKMVPKNIYVKRLKAVYDKMHEKKIHALYLSKPENIFYLTGKSAGNVLLTREKASLFAPPFFLKEYEKHYGVRNYPLKLFEHRRGQLKNIFTKLRCKKVAVDDLKFNQIIQEAKKISQLSDLILDVRSTKTKYELNLMGKAGKLAYKAMRYSQKIVGGGFKELEAVGLIQSKLYGWGSEKPSFGGGMLLSSPPFSADIHAQPMNRRICSGPVVVDLGAVVGGYYSDMTRTFKLGRLTKLQTDVVESVKNIQAEVVDNIYPGVKAGDVHEHAVKLISKHGFDFYHRIGHGVGLEIHENPRFTMESGHTLDVNTVFTIEPGVYLPQKFGVRFEDTYVMGRKKPKKLTK